MAVAEGESPERGDTFADRLAAVRRRLAAASARAGRDPETVRIVAVAKTFGPDQVREAADAGVAAIGENRVQEAAQKIPLCPGRLSWHLVGHLQSNKARLAVRLFDTLHGVDSAHALEAIGRAAEEEGKRMPVLLEVNVAGESSKFGLTPAAVPAVLDAARAWPAVDVRGFMTIPPFTPDPEGARPVFRRLRALRDEWRAATGWALDELSMGMSHDFEVAIEEGATWVRLGAALFGERRGKQWRPEGSAD